MGMMTDDGRLASRKIVLRATLRAPPPPSGPPVLGLMSKWGKLLEEMSIRMRWPALNRFEVGKASMATSTGLPGVRGDGADQDER